MPARTGLQHPIRKNSWLAILKQYRKIGALIEANVQTDYMQNIKVKVMREKEKHLLKWSKRRDYQNVLTIMPKEMINAAFGPAGDGKR